MTTINKTISLSRSDERRLWAKIEKTDGCWLWTAGKTPAGYGKFWLSGATELAHRIVYIALVGTVPYNLTLDHTCRVRHCVNPDHLDPVTQQENTLRSPIAPAAINAKKTHCLKGHPYSAANTHIANGRRREERQCRECSRIRTLARQRANGAVPRQFTKRGPACGF